MSPTGACAIEAARPSDLPGIRWLLGYDHLPNEDLTEQSLGHFFVCRDAIGVIGVVGIERFGSVGLLRSLVVAERYRDRGIGDRLVKAAEAECYRLGVESIYLLTTTAEKYFEARGYRRFDRSAAPLAIASSHQFVSLCPSTSILMRKS